jgi:RHS repeat-associated protein
LEKSTPFTEIENGRSGTAGINLFSKEYTFTHPDLTINSGNLSVGLFHFYSSLFSRTIRGTNNSLGWGVGWKTNLHQWLYKYKYAADADELKVVYTDGLGSDHIFLERWYYEKNGQKICIKRSEVYINTLGELAYLDPTGKEYLVKYKVKSDDGLTLTTSAGMFGYRDKTKFKSINRKYFDEHNNEIAMQGADLNLKLYSTPGPTSTPGFANAAELSWLNDNGLAITSPDFRNDFADNLWKYSFDISSALYYPTYVNSPLLYDGTDYFSMFAKAKHELQIVNQYKNSSVNLLTVKDKLESTKIKVEKSAVFDTTLTDYYETEEILQLKNQVEQYDNAIVEAKENAKNISGSLESAINGLEELKKSKARIHVSINQQKISYDPDNVNSDAFKMACYSLQGNLDQIELQIKSADGQIVSTKTSLARALRTVDEYELIRDNLQAKLAGLIKKQKEAPNDFITDEEGNILGFDYYGRLVLIADKYEKAIRIKFKEDKDLFEEIQTENGIIKFNYDSNELLKEIVDVNGKTICFSYTNPKFLSTIKYDDISAHNSTFAYQNDRLTKVTDAAGFNLTISSSTNSLFVVQSTTTKKINNDGLVGFAEQQTKKIIDLSLVKSGLNTTLTNNMNNDVATYSFDELGRPLNVISSRGADSEYNYAKYNDHGDVLIESTFSSRHILRKFIENGTSTGLSRTVLFSDTDDVSDNIWRGNLLNTDTLVYYFEFQSDSGQASFMATITITNRDGSSNIKQISITNQTKVLLLPIICNKDNIIQAKIETTSILQVKNFGIATGDGIFSAYDDDNLIEERQGLNTTLYLDFNHKKPTKIKTIDRYNNTKVSVLSYNDKGQLTYNEDQDGNIEERFYNPEGELLESVAYNKKSATDKTINKYEYDEDGNVTELNGLLPNKEGKINPTKKQYYPGTKKVNYQTAPNGLVTSYGFDFYNGSLLSKSAEVDGIANTTNYHYQFGFLTSVSHQEFDIHYEFDGQGRKTSVDVACNNIVKFEYDDNFMVDGYLGSKIITKYFNHGMLDNLITIISDIHGKTKSVSDTAGLNMAYSYDSFDRLTSTISSNESTHFEYDKRGNIKYSDIVYSDFGEVDFNYTYTVKDQVEEIITTISDTAELYKYKTKFIYDPVDRLIQAHNYFNINNLKSDDKLTNEYDFSNRLIKERIHIKNNDDPSEKHQLVVSEYLYLKSENQATNFIKKNVTTVLNDTRDVTTYNYDEMGNITRIKSSDNDITYEYDKLSRLTRENNRKLEYSQIFEYDESGNILRSEKYAYTKGELLTLISDNVYSYNQGNYQDQLVDFNGEEIIYDGLGRPTTYRNKTLVWSPRSTLLNYDDYQYQYNEQGIRIKKVVGDTTHKYFVNGTKILIEELNTNSVKKYLKYKYFGDKLYGFNYNEVDYYYLRNTQGDITSIINRNGIEVARYTYDAWGNHVVNNLTEDNIGNINPFRYRGYYYDKETQLYYLNARYYDPEVGRFISQDNISYLAPETINGLNLYAYCGNNPVMLSDSSGCSPWYSWLISGLQLAGGIALMFVPGAQGIGASLIVGGTLGLIANAAAPAIGQAIGGASSIANGWGAFSTGMSILGLGIPGLIGGIGLMLVGGATMAFGANEIVAATTGTNYIQQWTGMSDTAYGWTYFGLNLASSLGQMAGNAYRLHQTRTPRIGRAGELDGYRYVDRGGNPLFDFDYAHGGKINYNHFHGWAGPGLTGRTAGHWNYLRLIWWLISGR